MLPNNQNAPSLQGSFLPTDYIARKAAFRNNVITLCLFLLVMAGTVGAFLVTSFHWRKLKVRYEEVTAQCEAEQKKLEQLDQLRVQRAAMMEKAQITAALIERVPRWAVMGEIDFRMAPTMRLSELTLKGTRGEAAPLPVAPPPSIKRLTEKVADKQKDDDKPRVVAPTFNYALTLVGTAEQNNDVADYLASLKQSPVLRDVELTFIRDLKQQETVYRNYEITAKLRSDVDQKALASSLEGLVARRTAQVESAVPDQATQQPAQAPEKLSNVDQKGGL
jgi:hypothetical protein